MHYNTTTVNQIRKSLLCSDNTFKANSNNYGVVINLQSREHATTLCHSKNKRTISKPTLKPTNSNPPQREVEEFSKRRLQHKESCILNENSKDKANKTLPNSNYNKEKGNLIKALNKMQSYGLQLKELRKNNSLSLSCSDLKNVLNREVQASKSQSSDNLSMPSMEDVYYNISKITVSDSLTQWAKSFDALGEESTQETARTEELFTSDELLGVSAEC
jgi:hypothetical protein